MGGCFFSDKALFAYFFGQKKVREKPPFRKAKYIIFSTLPLKTFYTPQY